MLREKKRSFTEFQKLIIQIAIMFVNKVYLDYIVKVISMKNVKKYNQLSLNFLIIQKYKIVYTEMSILPVVIQNSNVQLIYHAGFYLTRTNFICM